MSQLPKTLMSATRVISVSIITLTACYSEPDEDTNLSPSLRSNPHDDVVGPLPFVTDACKESLDTDACCRENQQQSLLTNANDGLDQAAAQDDLCISALDGADDIVTGEGDDTVVAGAGADNIHLGEGDDVGFGGEGDDIIDGGRGEDLLYGGPGADQLRGSFGNDGLDGGEGNDLLKGGHGDDDIYGGPGDDSLHGDSGADRLLGGLGNDTINGGAGDDLLVGGPGQDRLSGGPGDDTFLVAAGCEVVAGDEIIGGPGNDTIVSPLAEQELLALGLVITGIENFVLDAAGPGSCYRLPDGALTCECCDDPTLSTATHCAECADGFRNNPEQAAFQGDYGDIGGAPIPSVLECVSNVTCDSHDCGNGTCDDSQGYPQCICTDGFIGASCNECRPGLTLVDGACVGTSECAHDFCNDNGECVASPMGRIACECEVGFEGTNCGIPDLRIGVEPGSIEIGESLDLYPSLANSANCPSGFDWTLVSGPGSIQQQPDGLQATYGAPNTLEDGQHVAAAKIRVECKDDSTMYQEYAACVLDDDSLPVQGTCKVELIPIDNAMLDHLSRTGQRGATLAVTHAEQLVYLRGYGWQNENETVEMLTCTPMRMASITKAITRAALIRLAEDMVVTNDGQPFSLSTNVMANYASLLGISEGDPGPNCAPDCATSQYIVPQARYNAFGPNLTACQTPFSTGLPDPRLWNIEVGEMFWHHSGLPTNDPLGNSLSTYTHVGFGDPANNEVNIANDLNLPASVPGWPKTTDIGRWLGGACLLDTPGILPQSVGGNGYSNVAYALLGEIIARTSADPQDTYIDFLSTRVFPSVGDANPGWTPADGMFIGDDFTQYDDVLFVGQSTPPLNPDEPDYLSAAPDAEAVANMAKFDGVWQPAGPILGAAYAYFVLGNQVSGGGLVANAGTLARFFIGHDIEGTPRVSGTPPRLGPVYAGNGYLSGTTAWTVAWQSQSQSYRIPAPSSPSGLLYNQLSTASATPPPGLVQAVIMFNSEAPRPNDPVFPNYDDGAQNPFLVIDGLTAVIGTAPLDDDINWPLPLTDAELDWGCQPYVPPPPPQSCGDGVLDQGEGEACDGLDLGGAICDDFPQFSGGMLACSQNCQFDFSSCINPLCGNGAIDPGEQCDPGNGMDPVSTGNPRSEQFCSPDSCLWTACGPFDAGREGCPCTDVGLDAEGDRCPGVDSNDAEDLICRHGPNHEAQPGLNPPDDGKRCMRCPYNDGNYGQGSGCPCGPGDSCQVWSHLHGGPQVSDCTRNDMVCRGPVGWLISDGFDGISRCWDVLDEDPYNDIGNLCDDQACAQIGQICLYGDCVDPVCVDEDGVPGICEAMGMICDPDPYGYGEPYCINTNGCDIGVSTVNGTTTCGPLATAGLINGDEGVSAEQVCPSPYRF